MPIPESPKPYYQKDVLDNAIDDFARKDKPTQTDLNRVGTIASIQAGLDKYRAAAAGMSQSQLRNEAHDSTRLGRNMEATDGKCRPPRCHAHAIVSGGHTRAAQARAVLAWLKLRIDDPYNGCWLPENTKATPHSLFPNAVPHSRIHRAYYYQWVAGTILLVKDRSRLLFELKMIALQLQQGTLPPHIMLPKNRTR
jgi:hypothetical protein